MCQPSDLSDEQIPLFVYGTLRHGQENYMLLRGNTLSEIPATISGMVIYSLSTYPVIVEGESVVHGDLMTIHPRSYSRVLEDLDQLEGYRPGDESCFYRRVVRCVKTASGHEVRAWLYLGRLDLIARRPHTLVAHGDWCRYRHDLVRSTRFARFAEEDHVKE
jgi:gamma-glutamylcyclotransferase (GGCT)/AIG2-like uncharacterized protein YtfP